MSFEIACTYQPTQAGYIFLPEDAESDSQCDLRVSFEPVAYYPAERDIGAASDYDARIILIEVADHSGAPTWRALAGEEYASAEAYLETYHHDTMWAEAEAETTEAFTGYRRAA